MATDEIDWDKINAWLIDHDYDLAAVPEEAIVEAINACGGSAQKQ